MAPPQGISPSAGGGSVWPRPRRISSPKRGQDFVAPATTAKGGFFLRKEIPFGNPKKIWAASAGFQLLLPPCEWVQSTLPSNAAASLLLAEVPASPLGGCCPAHCGTSRPGGGATPSKQHRAAAAERGASNVVRPHGGNRRWHYADGLFFFGNPKGFSFSQKRKVVWPLRAGAHVPRRPQAASSPVGHTEQIVRRGLEVFRQKDQLFIIGLSGPFFISLIGTKLNTQKSSHLGLLFSAVLSLLL